MHTHARLHMENSEAMSLKERQLRCYPRLSSNGGNVYEQ